MQVLGGWSPKRALLGCAVGQGGGSHEGHLAPSMDCYSHRLFPVIRPPLLLAQEDAAALLAHTSVTTAAARD